MFITTFCLNLLKFNGDEDTDIEALSAFVNFRYRCRYDHNINMATRDRVNEWSLNTRGIAVDDHDSS